MLLLESSEALLKSDATSEAEKTSLIELGNVPPAFVGHLLEDPSLFVVDRTETKKSKKNKLALHLSTATIESHHHFLNHSPRLSVQIRKLRVFRLDFGRVDRGVVC
jgi:hypothetical protein